MYKGYRIEETIIGNYEYPLTALVLVDAPAGCVVCEDQVQNGHNQCSVSLENDPNLFSRLEQGYGWFLEYVGDDYTLVDYWLTIIL